MPLIDPELLPFVDEVRAENAATAARMKESLSTFDVTGDVTGQLRALMEPGGVFGQPLSEMAEERTIHAPAGDIPIRVFVPPTVHAAYHSIHGAALNVTTTAETSSIGLADLPRPTETLPREDHCARDRHEHGDDGEPGAARPGR